MNRWGLFLAAVFIAISVATGAGMLIANLSSQSQGAVGGQPAIAKPVPVPTATPSCVPPGSKRCQDLLAKSSGDKQPAKADSGFDFGPAPSLPVLPGFIQSQPKPTPEPPAHEKVWDFTTGIPIIGGVFQGVATIISTIDWIFRNIWLVLIILAVIAMFLKVPIWTPAIIVWELTQTIWTRRRAHEVLREHRQDFRRGNQEGGNNNG